LPNQPKNQNQKNSNLAAKPTLTVPFSHSDLRTAKGLPLTKKKLDHHSGHSQSPSSSSSEDTPPSFANRHHHVTDWTQARLGRFPRPTHGPPLPPLTSLKGLWNPFDMDYDDYEFGPTLDVLESDPTLHVLNPTSFDLVYLADRIITSPWTMFKDYGYRLLPSFADLYHLSEPTMVIDHLMPVSLEHPPSQPIYSQTARSGDAIDIPNILVMGAKEMLQAADEEHNNLLFLTGRTAADQYICLDLQRDAVTPQHIIHSYDIDSLIWVTINPQFRQAVNVYTMPYIRKKPPIWKHNHVYVDLLVPQSEDDRLALGPRTEWWTRQFRLSHIPHLSLGHLGEGSGSINLYLFFPRMTHRHEHTHRWVSIIPPDIQALFWEKIVRPAMKKVSSELDHPYVGLSKEIMTLKIGMHGKKQNLQSSRVPTYPFRSNDFAHLISEMKDMVRVSLMYHLLFMVLKCNGIHSFQRYLTLEMILHTLVLLSLSLR